MVIQIDISDFVKKWNLQINLAILFEQSVLDTVAFEFRNELENQANESLRQTRQEYVRSIYTEKPDANTRIVGLRGWLANAVEQGVEPFDEKSGFANSTKKKRKKNGGWYLTIPFRHASPTALAESSIFASRLPKDVYKVALSRLVTDSARLERGDLPKQYQQPAVRAELVNLASGTLFPAYTHQAPIYEGLKRNQEANHSGYITFRNVSELSDPDSWIHSGIRAHNLTGKALDSMDIANVVASAKIDFYQNVINT